MVQNQSSASVSWRWRLVPPFSLTFMVNVSTADLNQSRDIRSAHDRQNLPFRLPELSNLGAKTELSAVWSFDINCCLIFSTCDWRSCAYYNNTEEIIFFSFLKGCFPDALTHGTFIFLRRKDGVSVAFRLAVLSTTPEVLAFTEAERGSSSDSTDISEGESRGVASCSEETADSVPPRLQLQLRYRGRPIKEWTLRQVAP